MKKRGGNRVYNLDALYEVRVFNPKRGRRECIFIAFGLVNSYWARRELGGTYPAHTARIRTDEMLKAALGL